MLEAYTVNCNAQHARHGDTGEDDGHGADCEMVDVNIAAIPSDGVLKRTLNRCRRGRMTHTRGKTSKKL